MQVRKMDKATTRFGKANGGKKYVTSTGKIHYYNPTRGSKQAIDEKIKVLKEFYVVDKDNEHIVRERLEKAVADHPDEDFDRIIDRVAWQMIEQKLG